MNFAPSMRLLALAMGLVLIVMAVAAISPPQAAAKACGEVKVKHTRLSVGGSPGVDCDFQRRWTKRFLRGGNEPGGWNCHKSSRTSGGCDKRRSAKFFVFYPSD